jgi:hypothetical protein
MSKNGVAYARQQQIAPRGQTVSVDRDGGGVPKVVQQIGDTKASTIQTM